MSVIEMGGRRYICIMTALLALHVISTAGLYCPTDTNCNCEGNLALDLNCLVDGNSVKISLLPNSYLNIYCGSARYIDYDKLPVLNENGTSIFNSVIFKECPLPSNSFKDVLGKIGVSKTTALIFQNSKNLSSDLSKKQFSGLTDLSKLSLSINGVTNVPDNLFEGMSNLTWLNIRSDGINLTQNLFRPLEKLEILEISHNDMTNISGNLFSHLTLLRKLSVWQSNVTSFSKDLFTGVNVLEELDLSSNSLNELPSSIFTPLRKLKKLTLFSNKLLTLPTGLLRDNKELDTITIFNNDVKLKYLSNGIFSGLRLLQEVYVQRCGLEIIPFDAFTNSPQITNISLAYNDIEVLPESVFNDQINLISLDISHNKLKTLPHSIFSSLVKLERLKISHNFLKCISSFSSLLSLLYFDAENNNLEVISSDLFNNSRQRMTINFAYNKLNLKHQITDENKIAYKSLSPFSHLHHLKMLNLSHNEIQNSFHDFWTNGHEQVDLSYNNIVDFVPNEKYVDDLLTSNDKIISHKVHMKYIWISNNPLTCDCKNYGFLSYMKKRHIKVADIDSFQWSSSVKAECDVVMSNLNVRKTSYKMVSFIISIFIIFMVAGLLLMTTLIKSNINFTEYVKMVCQGVMTLISELIYNKYNVLIIYCEKDENYIIEKISPPLKKQKSLKAEYKPLNEQTIKEQTFEKLVKNLKSPYAITLVLTRNYIDLIKTAPEFTKLCEECLNREIIFNVVSTIPSDQIDYSMISSGRSNARHFTREESLRGHFSNRANDEEDLLQRAEGHHDSLNLPTIIAQSNPC